MQQIFTLLLLISAVTVIRIVHGEEKSKGGESETKVTNLLRELNEELDGLYKNENFKGKGETKEQRKITKEVTDVGEQLKTEEKANGESSVESALKVIESITENLDKLKSDDVTEVMDGGLSIALTVASVIPPPAGTALTVVGSLAAMVMKYFTPVKSESDLLLSGFKDILLTENDQQIKQDLAGERNVIATQLAIMDNIKRLTKDQIERRMIKPTTGDEILGKLAYRIKSRATDGTESSGKATFYLAVSYANFATYRDIAFGRMIMLLGNSGRRGQNMIKDYQKAMEKHKDDYKAHLKLFYEPSYEHIDVMANYHPPMHNDASSMLTKFITRVGLPSPPVVDSGAYVVKSVKWPKYYFTGACENLLNYYQGRYPGYNGNIENIFNCWMRFKKGPPQRFNRIEFVRLPSGYYRMNMMDREEHKHVSATTSLDNTVKLKKTISSKIGGDIIVLKFGDKITFSNRDTPTLYWNGRKIRTAVYFDSNKDGYEDGKKYKLLKCKGKRWDEVCPDW